MLSGRHHVLCALAACAAVPAAAQETEERVWHEESRRVHVTFDRGVAIVETSIAVRSASDVRSEVELPTGVPADGEIFRARVCIGRRCRDAVPDRSPESLRAYELDLVAPRAGRGPVSPVARMTGRTVYAAPVSRDEPLDVTFAYLVPFEVHGGHAWLRLPCVGEQPTELDASTGELRSRAMVDGQALPVSVAPGRTVIVTAELPPGQRIASVWRTACGSEVCTRIWVASGLTARPRDVLLAIDASPSMEDVPEGRVERAIEAVLTSLPAASTVRAVVFGRDVDARIAAPVAPSAVDGASLLASPRSLGNFTYLARVAAHGASVLAGGRDPTIIVITDARLLTLPPSPFPISIVNVSDWPVPEHIVSRVTERGGVIVELGTAMSTSPVGPLPHLLSRLTATTVYERVRLPESDAAPLPSGEAVEWQGLGLHDPQASGLALRPRAPPAALSRALERFLDDEASPSDLVAVDASDFDAARAWAVGGARSYPGVRGAVDVEQRVTRVALAGPCDASTPRGQLAVCGQPPVPRRLPMIHTTLCDVRGSLSRDAIRRLMRHAAPAVRACFAQARRGRADFEASFTYRLVLGSREVMDADITTASPNIDAGLRSCLLQSPIESIVVPVVEGGGDDLIVVNYPFHTDRRPPPVHVELDPDLASILDAVTAEDGEAPAAQP